MVYIIRDRNDRLRGERRTRFFVAAFIIVFLVGIFLLARHRFQSWYVTLRGSQANVVQVVGNEVEIHTLSKRQLVARNAELSARIKTLEESQAYVSVLEDENASLRKLMSYSADRVPGHVAAVIGKPSENLYNRIIIDQGSLSGVIVGNRVGLYGTMLLGEVVSVSERTAIVELYSSPSHLFDGVIERAGITLSVQGKGGGNFEIHVPRDIKLQDGDTITFADQPDMLVGVIKSVVFDARDPFQTVLARTPVNIQELKYVEIFE